MHSINRLCRSEFHDYYGKKCVGSRLELGKCSIYVFQEYIYRNISVLISLSITHYSVTLSSNFELEKVPENCSQNIPRLQIKLNTVIPVTCKCHMTSLNQWGAKLCEVLGLVIKTKDKNFSDEGWKGKAAKCYWIKKQLGPFCINPRVVGKCDLWNTEDAR